MSESTIRLLEDRVQQAIGRLKELAAERGRIERELEDARRRMDVLEVERAEREEAWAAKVARLAQDLKEAIGELRAVADDHPEGSPGGSSGDREDTPE